MGEGSSEHAGGTPVPGSAVMAAGRRVVGVLGEVAKRMKVVEWLGVLVLVAYLLMTLIPGALATHDPIEQDIANRLAFPSAEHWFGTDELGRDLFSRCIHGARTSIRTAVIAVLFSMVVGVTGGLFSGYVGGRLDELLARTNDILVSFPGIIIAMALIAVTGRNPIALALVIGLVNTPAIFRVTRAVALQVRVLPYVDAARSAGASNLYIMFRTVLPNCHHGGVHPGVADRHPRDHHRIQPELPGAGDSAAGPLLGCDAQYRAQLPEAYGLVRRVPRPVPDGADPGAAVRLALFAARVTLVIGEGAAAGRDTLLVVEDLHTRFELERGVVQAVSGSSFSVDRSETLGIVGESGSGKSVTVRSILRLIRPPGRIAAGRVLLNGVGPAGARRARDDRRARPGDQHGIPGAVGRSEPGADGGRADLGRC